MVIISKDLPSGNIRVLSQEGSLSVIEEEQRDSRNEWFYWKFKAVFDAPGTYTFRFARPNKVGTRSAAVSFDRGASWEWLAQEQYESSQEFAFICAEPGEVWFCQGIPYLQREFDLFAGEFREHPAFHLSTLCKSRKGRGVELVTIREGSPALAVLLTSRHHCQEMSATHALEGIMRAVLADDDFGRSFRSRFALYIVPFMDKDGVIDGDQGKGRIPRDHGRDYYQKSIYPETAAVRELLDREKPFLALDLHSPWLRGGFTNETTYIVETSNPRFQPETERFARILEAESPDCAPFFYKDRIPWGVGWNCAANAGTGESFGCGLSGGCKNLDYVRFSTTLEIAFANFGKHTITRYELLQYGKAVARTIAKYADLTFRSPENDRAKLCFTGDIMCQKELTAACAKAGGTYDYGDVFRRSAPYFRDSDYCVGNLETCFAGPDAGYSSELYSFNTPDVFADALSDAGFTFVSTANNHCLDRGPAGLYRTLDVLDRAGIEHTGTSRTPEEQRKTVIRYIGGIKVGFVACTYGTNAFANHTFLREEEAFAVNLSQPQETLPGSVHLLDSMETIAANTAALPDGESPHFAMLRTAVEKTRAAGAEYIIILMHSGGQYNPEPDAFTEKLVRALLGWGADMIVGNHPHIIQKYAVRDGKPVFYCLGNVISTPSLSPEQMANPHHVNSIAVKPVLARTGGTVRMTSGTFRVMRSIQLPNGVTSVSPLYDLIAASTVPAEKKFLAQELRRSVRTFLNLPEDAPVGIRAEYDLPL